MHGLQARSPVGGAWEATTHWCLSPSLSPSLPLSLKINKTSSLKNIKIKPRVVKTAVQPHWNLVYHHTYSRPGVGQQLHSTCPHKWTKDKDSTVPGSPRSQQHDSQEPQVKTIQVSVNRRGGGCGLAVQHQSTAQRNAVWHLLHHGWTLKTEAKWNRPDTGQKTLQGSTELPQIGKLTETKTRACQDLGGAGKQSHYLMGAGFLFRGMRWFWKHKWLWLHHIVSVTDATTLHT